MRTWFVTIMALILCLTVASGAMAEMADPAQNADNSVESKSLNSLVNRIVKKSIKPGMSQFEKAVALYDWLIDNTVYQKGATQPYDVLKNGVATCSGYTNAYNVLLAEVGIRSYYVKGKVYGLEHMWNKVYLGGNWYHVDARMADHFKDVEGRYRRFGMSDEQASLIYSSSKINAKSHSANYAYKTGQLNPAIQYVRNAISTRAAAGETIFIVDPLASGAPPELEDAFNRITVKNVLKTMTCTYSDVPGKAEATVSLHDDRYLVCIEPPTHRIKKLIRNAPANVVVEVTGRNFSAIEPLDLRGTLEIVPAYATQQQLFWKSYREKTAIVDQDGQVKIVGFGKARIKVATIDGSRLSRVFTVTVKRK